MNSLAIWKTLSKWKIKYFTQIFNCPDEFFKFVLLNEHIFSIFKNEGFFFWKQDILNKNDLNQNYWLNREKSKLNIFYWVKAICLNTLTAKNDEWWISAKSPTKSFTEFFIFRK